MTHNRNPYQLMPKKNALLKKVQSQHKIKIAIVDVEFTLTSGQPPAIFQARQLLEKKFDLIILATDHPEETIIDTRHFENALQINSLRPRPHWHQENDLYTYTPPEQSVPNGLLNPDIIIASSGTKIAIKNKNKTYAYDLEYERHYPSTWYAQTIIELQAHFPFIRFPTQGGSLPADYELGHSIYYPHQYKIPINFKSYQQLRKFTEIHHQLDISSWHLTNDSNPLTKNFTGYITPQPQPKAAAANHLIDHLQKNYALNPQDIEVFIIGDSLPDLHLTLMVKPEIDISLLVVGESPLFPYLSKGHFTKYAGENIKSITKQIKQYPNKKIIIGDRTYPGTKGPETIMAYLLRNPKTTPQSA